LLSSDTDEQLMAAVQGGDSSALGELFNRHHAALFRYFLRMSASASLSEDLTQEVFLRLLKKNETWHRDARFSSWMYRIAHNAFIDQTRRRKWETAMPENMDIAAPAGRQLEHDEEQALLHRALMAMPPDKRELLILSRFQGLKYDQIGELLGVETNTVKVRVFRALGQLREIYERLSGAPGLSAAGGRS
jgi:RNA polymerase sigma-70 factor (ECF subfamily)